MAEEGIDSRVCLSLLILGVVGLRDDAREFTRHVLLRLEFLEELVIVRVEDEHLFLGHSSEGVIRGNYRPQQFRMIALIVRQHSGYLVPISHVNHLDQLLALLHCLHLLALRIVRIGA